MDHGEGDPSRPDEHFLSAGAAKKQFAVRLVVLGFVALLFPSLAQAQQPPGKAQRAWAEYQLFAPQRAFAVSADGEASQWWAAAGGEDPGKAAEQALSRCTAQGRSACSLWAVNNIVLAGRDWRSTAPVVLPPIGRLRAQPFWQNAGPQAAAGLIVWSHGYMAGKDSTLTPPQAWVGQFLARGYDLYRFDREWIRDWPGDATALADAVRQAKALGYRRVILAGQSAGAWVSMAAALRGAPADGVVAVSPAHHGEVRSMRDSTVARAEWQQIVRGLKPGSRIVVAFFDGDDYDVGGRGDDARAAFAQSGVQAEVIDRPPGFKGHFGGSDFAFARSYGACLSAFVESGARQAPCAGP